jgi:acid stress-induced BolA-like protein IbaG/YrbA
MIALFVTFFHLCLFWLVYILHMEHNFLVCVVYEFCVSKHHHHQGKNVVQRQRLIYKAIWDEMSGPVHAVDSIIAKTPTEMGL